jgi:EAL domain-containing protein (putative c-di-GMP-specific phosphodiesterase class I)
LIETGRDPGSPAPPLAGPRGRILLVEDQPALRRGYARILENAGYVVIQAADGLRATVALATGCFDLILTDVTMPGMSGTQLLRAVRAREMDVPVLLITASPTVESAVDAIQHGAVGYLIKPVSPADLIAAVERATKLARIAGVEREVADYLDSLEKPAVDQSMLDASFRSACDTMWMAYQPIVDWRSKEIHAYEALVRTDEPSVRNPHRLFTLAEHRRALHDVGRRIRASVSRTITDFPTSVDVFVNLHPADLLDDSLYSRDAPLSAFAGRVILEVTERKPLDQTADIPTRARRLRELGYRIAIDDLGAGYAGLTYFAQLSPDVVKIDTTLVRDIDRETIKQKLVGSLVTLCMDLGMLVVAEGVETVEEREALVDLGCDLLQGYLFARPGRPYPEVTWSPRPAHVPGGTRSSSVMH